MSRPFHGRCAAVLLLLFLPGSAPGEEPPSPPAGPTSPSPSSSWVRVSLDPDDPYVQSIEDESADVVTFWIWAQGREAVRGIDFGLLVDGGEFVAYSLPTDRTWIALPLVDGYPESVGQALVGPVCLAEPIRIGSLVVRANETGGSVGVEPTLSAWSQGAYLLDCQNRPLYSFYGYGARVNGKPSPPRFVRGDESLPGKHDPAGDGFLEPEE
jgi:hypothetical protein